MFKSRLLLFCCAWLTCFIALGWFLHAPGTDSAERYRNLIAGEIQNTTKKTDPFISQKLKGWTFTSQEGPDADLNAPFIKGQADTVEYADGRILLTQNVKIQHDWGTIHADQIILTPLKKKPLRLSHMRVSGNIQIDFKGGAQLQCPEAEIDEEKLWGRFYGSSGIPSVNFSFPVQSAAAPSRVCLNSPQIETFFTTASHLDHIAIQGPILTTYKEIYTVQAASGIYRPVDAKTPQEGVLTLSSQSTATPCLLSHSNGDRIEGSAIILDSRQQGLNLIHPKGSLSSLDGSKQKEPLTFRADSLHWLPELQELALASSPGSTDQVVIENEWGEMDADKVRIQYAAPKEVQPMPNSSRCNGIKAEGNVRVASRFDKATGNSTGVLHYTLSQTLDYNPNQRELHLKGNEKNRVLFFDQINQTQMSAPDLVIILGEQGQKPVIKGSGDVRFTFMEEEYRRMKQHLTGNKVEK